MKTKQSKGRGRRRWRREWEVEVQGWRQSGQSAETYAKARGLTKGSLLRWSRQLRREPETLAGATQEGGRAGFLAVKVREAQAEPTEDALEVVLANGRRVRIGGNFDSDRVARLLAVVEGGAAC